MEKNKSVILKLLKFEFELGYSAKDAIDNINQAKGPETVLKTTAYEWFSRLKHQISMGDKKRSQKVDRVSVVNAVEEHLSMTICMLVKNFDSHYSTI